MNRNETAPQVPNVELIPEPAVEPDFEYFISREEREYRKWKESGGDIAFLLVELLSHGRRAEISMSEIATTQIYKRSNAAERMALEFVCSQSAEVPVSPNDAVKLKSNDQLLMDFCDGKLLGHRDFQTRVLSIPAKLDEKRHFDQRMLPFASKYENPAIFAWIIGGAPTSDAVVPS